MPPTNRITTPGGAGDTPSPREVDFTSLRAFLDRPTRLFHRAAPDPVELAEFERFKERFEIMRQRGENKGWLSWADFSYSEPRGEIVFDESEEEYDQRILNWQDGMRRSTTITGNVPPTGWVTGNGGNTSTYTISDLRIEVTP